MNIIYTSKAKNDLARIDWRIREKIITSLASYSERPTPRRLPFKKIDGSDLVKTTVEKHVVVGEADGKMLNVISILKQQKLKPSGVKFMAA